MKIESIKEKEVLSSSSFILWTTFKISPESKEEIEEIHNINPELKPIVYIDNNNNLKIMFEILRRD